jgi:hypothetical protein
MDRISALYSGHSNWNIVHWFKIMTVSQKSPGIVVYHYNGTIYDNAYLITFEVGPLRAHTIAPSVLLLLEAPTEGLFRNLLEFDHRIPFDVLHGCETLPLETHFQSRKQPKFTRSEIQRVWCLVDDKNTCAMQFGETARLVAGREEVCLLHDNICTEPQIFCCVCFTITFAPSHKSFVVSASRKHLHRATNLLLCLHQDNICTEPQIFCCVCITITFAPSHKSFVVSASR